MAKHPITRVIDYQITPVIENVKQAVSSSHLRRLRVTG
jgi:hypothetical protein